mmetsp:Transcript_81001/g.234867  ORF Transcript_81001/g.234867 Transcript_81001/m.234867 type:complete len:213 (-) Transcript_81001:1449-2087(-)
MPWWRRPGPQMRPAAMKSTREPQRAATTRRQRSAHSLKDLMSTRARRKRLPLSAGAPASAAGAGVSQISAKVPRAAGRQTLPGFTTSLPSTNWPDAVPVADGKTRTSGSSPPGKSKAAARFSEMFAGSRGTTGKSVRCCSKTRRARSMRRSSGRRTRPERSTGLSASVEVTVRRRPSMFKWAGFGKSFAPIFRNMSEPSSPRLGPRDASSGG